jgi:cell wall-associated NlpC family hydrolase
MGTAVTGDVEPGDLVFFDTGGPGPSDVGIASGPDSAISATTHGVREHTLTGPYWGDHFVGARRLD